ncbi:MAG: deoxyguanosinetriphosphate triphosphohydrolase [Eubacterium sp.]|nr:deoxyguanosinetriphosphate triphosphohydrolase [Eubacterium sp.]
MTIRETLEATEEKELSPFASLSRCTKGRERPIEDDRVRTDYMRDRDRILHSKSFRRLKDKTQVFLSPQGDHYRTRLVHTLEVSQLSRTVAKALHLNEDLVEAIALGHDLGHTPFGHAGERALHALSPYGFHHYEQSVRVVERLENNGKGLNLTWEVRDGIFRHQMELMPATLEGRIVRLCDKIAYIHHDMDDAERAGIIDESMIPDHLRRILGGNHKERLNTLIMDMIFSSNGKPDILQSPEIRDAMMEIRALMFRTVYTDSIAKAEEVKVTRMLEQMYHYYLEHPQDLTDEFRMLLEEGEPKEKVICDYISGMTDQYCIHCYNRLFVPKSWDVF